MTRARLVAAAIITALLAAVLPVAAAVPAAAETGWGSGVRFSSESSWKSPPGVTRDPGPGLSCSAYNDGRLGSATPAQHGGVARKQVSLWLNPDKRVQFAQPATPAYATATTSTPSFPLEMGDEAGSRTVPSMTAQQWADAAGVGDWNTTMWHKVDGSLPSAVNDVRVAQLVGAVAYTAHYWYSCEKYDTVEVSYDCEKADPVTGRLVTVVNGCTRLEKRNVSTVDRLWEADTNGVIYGDIQDTQSWAGFGTGWCVRTYNGSLSGPYNPDWTQREKFLDGVKFERGASYDMADKWNPATADQVGLAGRTPDETFLADTAGVVTTTYGLRPGYGGGNTGWRWCIGLKLPTGEWSTDISSMGRYTGRITFNSDWVTFTQFPDTPYPQKWDWIPQWLNGQPNAATRQWTDPTLPATRYHDTTYYFMQVGRVDATIAKGGINTTSLDKGLYYVKTCWNAAAAGKAMESDYRTQQTYTTDANTPLTYIEANPAAPLDRNAITWPDGYTTQYYYMNGCGNPVPTDRTWNPPAAPNLKLTCMDSREEPAYLAWNRAYGVTGQAIQPAGGVASVRADGQTTAVNFAPKGPVYVATEGGTVDRASVEWRLRVDVPSQLGLNSPSLLGSIPAKVNDRGQPYTPVGWASIDSQNRTPSPTWWDLATWHDIDTLTRDDSYTVTPEKTYTTRPEYKDYTFHQEFVRTGGHVEYSGSPNGGTYYGQNAWNPNDGSPAGFYKVVSEGYYRPVKDAPPAGWGDNGSHYQRSVTTLDPAPYSTCGHYGTVWRCGIEVVHDAAGIPGYGMRFYESAVDARYWQSAASWLRTSMVTTDTATVSSFGFLAGSTMDGDIGSGASTGWSVSSGTAPLTERYDMMCVSSPAGLHAQRVASTVVAR